jgi:hypothetical protein
LKKNIQIESSNSNIIEIKKAVILLLSLKLINKIFVYTIIPNLDQWINQSNKNEELMMTTNKQIQKSFAIY